MEAQTPAKGIVELYDYCSSKMYKVVCECTDDDCSHTVDIESEEDNVIVTIHTQQKTNFLSKSRWRYIWQLLTKGQASFETSIILSEQAALNYTETLKSAVNDVKEYRLKRKKNEN